MNEKTKNYNRSAEGNPAGYLPGNVLPSAVELLGKGHVFSLKITGCVVNLGDKKYMEIHKAELL